MSNERNGIGRVGAELGQNWGRWRFCAWIFPPFLCPNKDFSNCLGKNRKYVYIEWDLLGFLFSILQFYVEYDLRKIKIIVPFFYQLINFDKLIFRF